MGSAVRRQDWPERLEAFVQARRGIPFAWGTNDCGTFAADAILAMTDMDVLADLRDSWTDEGTANAVIEAGGGIIKVVGAILGQSIKPAVARRGDILLANDIPGLYVCIGPMMVGPGDKGLAYRMVTRDALIGWSV